MPIRGRAQRSQDVEGISTPDMRLNLRTLRKGSGNGMREASAIRFGFAVGSWIHKINSDTVGAHTKSKWRNLMNISITSRHFKAEPALKTYAENKVSKLNRFFDGVVHCDVVFLNEHSKPNGTDKMVEIKLSVHDKVLKAVETTDDYFKAIDKVVDRLETQLVKFKQKIRHE
jgi:ribosomal subunit interface protein